MTINTKFKDVTTLDNQGTPLSGTSTNKSSTTSDAANFGSCSAPQIKFAAGLDGRKETAFEPVDLGMRRHNTLRRNITLKGINLAILGIAKVVYFWNNSVIVRGE